MGHTLDSPDWAGVTDVTESRDTNQKTNSDLIPSVLKGGPASCSPLRF